MDGRAVTRELLLRHFGCVLALSEAIVLVVGGRRLLLRVTATNSLDAEAQEERVAYHCFRGEGREGRTCSVRGWGDEWSVSCCWCSRGHG